MPWRVGGVVRDSRGGRRRPPLTVEQRTTLLPYFESDVALLGRLTELERQIEVEGRALRAAQEDIVFDVLEMRRSESY